MIADMPHKAGWGHSVAEERLNIADGKPGLKHGFYIAMITSATDSEFKRLRKHCKTLSPSEERFKLVCGCRREISLKFVTMQNEINAMNTLYILIRWGVL